MATLANEHEHSISPPQVAQYCCRKAEGVEQLSSLEAKWPTVDLEAAAEIVGRELLGIADSTSPTRSRCQSIAALRSEVLAGGGEWGGPMASFGWNLAAATAFGDEQTAVLLIAHDVDGIVRAVAPLARATKFGCRWEMLGVRRLNEPADFIYTDREALRDLIDRLVRLRRPLLLNRMPANSPTIEMIKRAASGRAVVAIRPQASCPFIPLDESWSVPESHFSSRRRSDYRRAMRRAERHGDVRAEVFSPTPANLEGLLQTAYDIEARSWKGAAGTALACDPLRGSHLRQFAAWAANAGTLRIALLWIGRQPIAMQIATEESGRWWLLKIGFDPAWSDCSPGNLLLGETVRYAVRQQLTSYEFLGTAEPWTQVWTAHERPCVSVRVYPFGMRGGAVLAADALEIAGRAVREKFRGWLERRRGAGNTSSTSPQPGSGETIDTTSTD